MATCPPVIASSIIITKTGQLTGDNTDTNVGAVVNLKCASNYELVGSSKLTCLSSGQWDNPKPTCRLPIANDDTQLNTIIIAVCSVLSVLVVASLLIIVLIYFKKKKRLEKEEDRKLDKYHDGERDDDESTIADSRWAPRSSRSPYYVESYNRDKKSAYGPRSHTSTRDSHSRPPPYDDRSEISLHSGLAKKWTPSYGGRSPFDMSRATNNYEEHYGPSFNRDSHMYRSYDTPRRSEYPSAKSPYGRSIRDEYAADMADFSRNTSQMQNRDYELRKPREMHDPFSRSYLGSSSMPRAQVHSYRSSERMQRY